MRWIKVVAVYLFVVGFLYLVLAYIAEFSMRQSMVLALLIASLARGIASAARKPARRFSPYYVRVNPYWPQLLTDFKLIDKDEEWHAIQKSFEDLPSTEYRFLRSGVCFTVVHQSENFERTLIYSNNRRVFVSEVDFEDDMEPIKIERKREIRGEKYQDVRFLMKFSGDGYDLGMRVPDWWWDEVKASCPTPMKEHRDYPTGYVELVLTTISYREFDLYWEPVEWSSTFFNKTAKQIRDRRNEQRKKFGWKTVEHEDIPELSIDWPESIEHKYFNVEHRAI